MRDLTPYDTGERLQPFVWKDLADPEDYGNVDFDSDEGITELTVHVSAGPDGYVVHIIPQNDLTPVAIEWHGEGSAKIHEEN